MLSLNESNAILTFSQLLQMRIIHGQGYTIDEKRSYISVIYQNIFTSLKVLVQAMENLG